MTLQHLLRSVLGLSSRQTRMAKQQGGVTVNDAPFFANQPLAAGMIVNRSYAVWDYRHLPLNFHGQICLPFFLLWIPLSLLGMGLYRLTNRSLSEKRPRASEQAGA